MTTAVLLSHDVSDNSLGRAYVLALALQRFCRVTIVGPLFYRDSTWPPCQSGAVTIKSVRGAYYPRWLSTQQELRSLLGNCDLMYAVKPRPASFGVALQAKAEMHVPLLLDIDDWESGAYLGLPAARRLVTKLNLLNPNGYLHTSRLERCTDQADAISTVSTALQRRYGGTIIPHGRDPNLYNPAIYDPLAMRREYGLPNDRCLLLFLGTPRRHKGIDLLLEALETLVGSRSRSKLHCVLAGLDWEHPLTQQIRERSAHLPVTLIGMLPVLEVPRLLAACDIAVIPQSDSGFANAQIPAKLIDAMAMAKPIVAGAVSDIPAILQGCGIVVHPGDSMAIADAIESLLDNATWSERLGNAARERFLREYTIGTMADRLKNIITELGIHKHSD